ncbi:Beta-glucan synthesis-associated protein [Globisporangium polare]
MARRHAVFTALLTAAIAFHNTGVQGAENAVKSGLGVWIDPATPADRQVYVSSRGEPWDLVMSDEFNLPGRSFRPGDDHMWTSLDKPDGVNAALEVYSHNMTSTQCDSDGTCYLYIKAQDEVIPMRVWNDYQNPPGYKKVTFFYRSAMVQSWNKFCFQGGMVEVRTQLPGFVGPENPDIKGGASARASTVKYYPTWPGIWLMGNLGRAVFSASTSRVWPFSYNECNDKVFLSSNQRISACDANPGSGMNPNQGRGAPEIDIIEGSSTEISTSIQVGPGMPRDFRILYPTEDPGVGCVYFGTCTTTGANAPDLPTKYYASKRGHKSWYQGMKYAANNFCAPDAKLKQDYKTVKAALDAGVAENACTLTNCPASKDPNADLGLLDGSKTDHWGINSNGTCYPLMNGYTGSYLCSPGNPSSKCESSNVPQSDKVQVFEYQMDALSANWPIHVAAYTDYLVYQIEWVMGNNGYIRWMLAGQPLYEIPANALTKPPQDAAKSNPVKLMIEEPMYMIFNVALSSTWGAKPPNPGKPCRGDGSDAEVNMICDEFPMYLKVDYIRVYQDTSADSTMAVGCDPKSHPTKQWILDHIESYQDFDNLVADVSGKAFCRNDDDCTISTTNKTNKVSTGSCIKSRCKCIGASWNGPRCTITLGAVLGNSSSSSTEVSTTYGPPWFIALGTSGFTILATFLAVFLSMRSDAKANTVLRQKSAAAATSNQNNANMNMHQSNHNGFARGSHGMDGRMSAGGAKANYSTNFI